MTKMDTYSDRCSGTVVLLVDSLGVNVSKFKKNFIIRLGRGEMGINYNADLKGPKNVKCLLHRASVLQILIPCGSSNTCNRTLLRRSWTIWQLIGAKNSLK